jgi:hypothetical protein
MRLALSTLIAMTFAVSAAHADCEGVPGPMCSQLSQHELGAVIFYKGCMQSRAGMLGADGVHMDVADYCERLRRIALANAPGHSPESDVVNQVATAALSGVWLCDHRSIPGCTRN